MTQVTSPGSLAGTAAAVVEMRGICITFPSVKALEDVDFRLRPGEVHALMGENGAGKSTLIKALTGVYTIDSGSVVVDGQERQFHTPADSQAAGISTVYQEVNLCPNLTVAENMLLGREPRRFGRIDVRAMNAKAAAVLDRLGLTIDPGSLLGDHPIAIQQLVAIGRAVAVDARVLILDEPTSSLDAEEVAKLFVVMNTLRAEGVALLFVSHFLDQVFEISDRMTVLRNGKLVGEYLTADVTQLGIVQAMIGRELETLVKLEHHVEPGSLDESGRPVLKVLGLGRKEVSKP